MNTWVVIPAFNEESVIGPIVVQVRRKFPVVVVDDASGDRTADIAEQSGAIVLRHVINRGQGAALKTGIDFALLRGADAVVTFDADGQHRVEDIDALLAPIASGTHDVALGSRFLKDGSNIPPLRRFILRLAVLFTRIFSHIKVTDTHNGLRAFTKGAALKIRIKQDRMAHASEILDEIVHYGLRYTEVPVTITYSHYSKAKGQGNLAMFRIALKYLIHKISR